MLPSVNLQQSYKGNPGEISKREVRVSEGSSNRESTVNVPHRVASELLEHTPTLC